MWQQHPFILPFLQTEKQRNLTCVLHCDETWQAFESTGEMWKTQAAGEYFPHFLSVLKCL